MSKTYDVAVVGATGAVGDTMIRVLEERNFPVGKLYALASERSAGKIVQFKGQNIRVENLATFDLSKVQMIGWTLIAVGSYIINVIHQIDQIHTNPNYVSQLPDIDAALMVLMGLAQGAYLGKKLVTTEPGGTDTEGTGDGAGEGTTGETGTMGNGTMGNGTDEEP